jgi:DNA invertase Pin-like site-specific DNA recombinase
MAKGKFISYLRVSTDKQGRSGLGLEAQREAVTRYLNGGRWTLAAEYIETESGKRNDRPKLTAALRHAICDLPHVPAGAMGRFLLTQMASVAELEAGLISERTKAALAAAKARGVKLGNPNGARCLRGKQVGNEAVAAIKRKAQEHATNLRSIVEDIRADGITSIRRIADELNHRGILAPRGGDWQPTTVVRLLARLSVQTRQSSSRESPGH